MFRVKMMTQHVQHSFLTPDSTTEGIGNIACGWPGLLQGLDLFTST